MPLCAWLSAYAIIRIFRFRLIEEGKISSLIEIKQKRTPIFLFYLNDENAVIPHTFQMELLAFLFLFGSILIQCMVQNEMQNLFLSFYG